MPAVRITIVALIVGVTTLGIPGHTTARATPPESRRAAVALGARPTPVRPLALQAHLPWRANLLALSWEATDREADGVRAHIRTRSGGPWSDPIDLVVEEHEGPDPGTEPNLSHRVFTLPMWVGTVDEVSVSVHVSGDASPVRDVRVEAINTKGDAEPVPVLTRAARAVGRFLTSTATQPAEAWTKKPGIISRAGWGADESLRSSGPGLASHVDMAFVHHTAGTNSYPKSDSAAIVRGIYEYHTKALGYSDIGYNFLIDRYGQIFEGRAGGIREPVIGAHAGGFNTYSTGVSLMGTFTSVSPPRKMRNALVRLLAWKLDIHHVKPTGRVTMVAQSNGSKYDAGDRVRFRRISGHREASATACPGSRTMDLLPSIRDRVEGRGNPKIWKPRLNRDELRPNGDGVLDRVRARALFSRKVNWTWSVLDASGRAAYRARGTGKDMDERWDGTGLDGTLVPSARYVWRLEATRTTNGRKARPAEGILTVLTDQPGGCAGCFAPGASADFDGDGVGDLAIGVPGEDVGRRVDAGAVNVLYGTAAQGPTGDGDQFLREKVLSRGRSEAGDGFGTALAAGDFDGDGFHDLAIGAPAEDRTGIPDVGTVTVVYGSAGGLQRTEVQSVWRGDYGVTPEVGTAYGASLAVGDLDADGLDDLVVGAPGATKRGRPGAGLVAALYGSAEGLEIRSGQVWHQGRSGISTKPEAGDRFGAAVTSADVDGDGYDDAIVGIPGEGLSGRQGAGAIQVIYGTADGLGAGGAEMWSQRHAPVGDEHETGDRAGFAVAAGDLNGDGRAEVVVGIPGEELGSVEDAGAVVVLGGSSAGLDLAGAQTIHADKVGVPGDAAPGDGFGASLLIANLNGNPAGDLVIGTPRDDVEGVHDAGSVTVLYGGAPGGLLTGVAQLWHQDAPGVKDRAGDGEAFGAALSAGDIDGDGIADLAIGVPGEDVGGIPRAGMVAVLFGTPSGLDASRDQRWHQNRGGVRSKAQLGDLLGSL